MTITFFDPLESECRPVTLNQLPFTHVTPWENFTQIIDDGYLKPAQCPVFKEELTYLSYGDLAFRPSRDKPSWLDRFPVVMIFSPTILRYLLRFFPFDTGAIAAGRFGGLHQGFAGNFRAYSIPYTKRSTPDAWVSYQYGSNRNYLRRRPRAFTDTRFSDELLYLRETCRQCASIVHNGGFVDYHLISTIECHFNKRIPITEHLVWLGIPERARKSHAFLDAPRLKHVPIMFYEEQNNSAGLTSNIIENVQMLIHQFSVKSD
jgi:hypothetical protein